MASYVGQRDRLMTVPGIARVTAEVVLAETGVDMSRFPTAAHLASWTGFCPGNNESAGNAGPAGRHRRCSPDRRRAVPGG